MAEHRGFLGSEKTLYDTIMADTHHYTFVQTHRRYITKSELWIFGEYDVSVLTHQ